ncbi:MAG: tRNA 2-thiouridine(34) synthase MnmA, partial [Gammaproteobacteria bacterium]|nr:tRNA 2-thiouridine(34) synthase MnmA [Gammaproteobacteria bacterium]
ERVFQDFLSEYRAGRTPNPDVLCNKEIKFKEFLDAAHRLGADFIATGHYARIDRADDGLRLLKGIDCSKDQSYFLYTLNQSALARTLFPIGHLAKSEVRKRAKSAGLATHDKKDSTGICFIGTRNFRSFLQKYLPPKPGPIMSVDGDYLGNHDGPMYYTLGQRQGLGIGGPGDAWYVVSKNIERNALVVAQGHDHPALYHNVLEAHHLHWIADSPPKLPLRCTAKTRYRQSDQECTIEKIQHDTAVVAFDEPQRALTPGQSIVFNQDTECLGGGIISNASNSPEMDMALSAP